MNYISKFAFNHKLLYEFKGSEFAPFRVLCIFGFVAIRKVSPKIDFALVSRKDTRRPGRRFIVRGLNADGHAANFAETEQVITLEGNTPSQMTVAVHLQIRGSIPLVWSMKPNMKWSPPVIVSGNFDESF